MYAVIMAGGKGTRIASVNSLVPKPMIEISGKPILLYQIENLKKQGIVDIILVCGHLKEVIYNFFGNGQKYGVSIEYIMEDEPLGTAGALSLLKDKFEDDFFLINGDIIFDIDIARMINFHKEKKALITIFTHPNNHPYDSTLIETDGNLAIIDLYAKNENRGWKKNLVNAGIHLLSNKLFSDTHVSYLFTEPKYLDLDKDILRSLVNTDKLFAYVSPEYVVDMGTPDRYSLVTSDIESGKPQSKNLSNPQKAVFLDRDGTVNKYVGFLTDINQLELIPGVAEAVKIINSKGYLVIIITNQPVIARGDITFKELDEIHNKMETLLGYEGAYIDGIYFCPHHPDKGFAGEIEELKIKCDCRKPGIGLVLQAACDYNIDLSKSWFVGDSSVDVLTGQNAGCHTALISQNISDQVGDYASLYDFAINLK